MELRINRVRINRARPVILRLNSNGSVVANVEAILLNHSDASCIFWDKIQRIDIPGSPSKIEDVSIINL